MNEPHGDRETDREKDRTRHRERKSVRDRDRDSGSGDSQSGRGSAPPILQISIATPVLGSASLGARPQSSLSISVSDRTLSPPSLPLSGGLSGSLSAALSTATIDDALSPKAKSQLADILFSETPVARKAASPFPTKANTDSDTGAKPNSRRQTLARRGHSPQSASPLRERERDREGDALIRRSLSALESFPPRLPHSQSLKDTGSGSCLFRENCPFSPLRVHFCSRLRFACVSLP